MGQDETERMLRAVTRANARLVALGLQDVVSIVYTGGVARLLYTDGHEVAVEEGPPALACGVLVARLRMGLEALLRA